MKGRGSRKKGTEHHVKSSTRSKEGQNVKDDENIYYTIYVRKKNETTMINKLNKIQLLKNDAT